MKHITQILCLLLVLFTASPAHAAEEKKEGIDLQGILMGHIKDAYEWHITDIGSHKVILHLPVIVKSSTGWHAFCSSQFSEEADEKGNRPGPYGLYISGSEKHEHKVCEMVNGKEVRPFDISITKTVVVLFIDAIILLLCILIPARWCRKHKVDDPAPKGFTGLMHMFVMNVYDDIIKPTLGEESDKYAPYLLTCFFFIFVANIMGIVPFPPGGGNLTGNITCTCFLALCTYVITNVTGTKAYWKDIFWGDVPTWLKVPVPLMPVIEFFSTLTKPFALMVRLFANMMAGHAIALSFACIIFVMFAINAAFGTAMTVVSVAMSIFMMLLEVLVSYIQAMVFTMLSAVFISLAHVREAEEHSH
ncbi:F0F1 ATP synthase subunit A [Prevotella sp. kh1p2]|uniref:F0F1 ATP synthase subunit A n=1 Tax=Prevotella sp. kh1p2 TaxID=1761883 RepID=UPI0008D5BFD2|nr:F0F1 ATP synthase subunit A [Prevotella sp. kh1p2]SET30099.1 F-type H+-transporting ATPase subunit a [Prevotella sp. kh1p2]SNU12564.1 F-type H+-transporting ATPase subunit a [Prevotellaceae bacterium KH2P17]